jgi:hypothetical protein
MRATWIGPGAFLAAVVLAGCGAAGGGHPSAPAAGAAPAETTTSVLPTPGADALAKAHDICLGGFERFGLVGFAAEHGITMSAEQRQRPGSEQTERELLVGIGQRVGDPFGYEFDEARDGCDRAYADWVRAGRPMQDGPQAVAGVERR